MRRLLPSPLMTAMAMIALSVPPVGIAQAEPPERVFVLVIYGDDPCPQKTENKEDEEIVVCARRPESERYRIPKKLREQAAPVGGPGWASQVANMEEAGRSLMPGSCSVNGSAGQTGCIQAMLRQWFAERRMQQSSGVP
ncbi:MAG: hypothetical protein E2598_10875 [Sphingobium sp.]|nr:hypothetical protein [Sphingobium sp.]